MLGNQTFDAEVRNNNELIEKIEITTPHDGKKSAEEYREVIDRGFSTPTTYAPGADLEKMRPVIIKTAEKNPRKTIRTACL